MGLQDAQDRLPWTCIGGRRHAFTFLILSIDPYRLTPKDCENFTRPFMLAATTEWRSLTLLPWIYGRRSIELDTSLLPDARISVTPSVRSKILG
jgi:hypothetical protein